ncbi:WGR domain-containing protein [Breznakiella homolactica]|uniref:WGR domain-containing protein n=1 Tax=Breznakiella homolactica TaxID=2798577 RepID=A0A7T8BD45_9SPIR|nr:WGR domain-containing protein [Breznakiella homolactica]QQO10878.1 WGR domain-containing protein [Breznakiella homolactica]
MKYYEQDSKFWAITVNGDSFTVQFGKTGTAGQTQEKTFDDAETAAKEAEKLIKSKTKKGYAEKPAPDSLAAAAAKPKEKAAPKAMPERPKPKAQAIPEPGPDITDGGERKRYKKNDIDFDDDDDFDLEKMRTPEVVDVKPQAERGSEPKGDAPAEAVNAGFDSEAFNAAKQALKKAVKRGRGESAAVLVENLKKANPTDEQLREVYTSAVTQMFGDNIYYVSQQHIDLPVLMAEDGVDAAAIYKEFTESDDYDKDEVKPLMDRIGKAILKAGTAPEPGTLSAAIEEAVTSLYNAAADIAIKQIKEVVENIRAGKQEKIEGKKLPDGEVGFMIDASDPVAIYTALGRERLIRQDFDKIDDVKGPVIKRYLTPVIRPKLEKLMDEGFFDDIANGYLWIGLYSDSEPIVERRLDEKKLAEKAKEVEADLKMLEETEDFASTAELYDKTVRLYLNPNGIIADKDTDRMLALIKRFLYSGEEQAEELSRDLLNKFDGLDYGKWRHTFVSYIWDNMDFQWARDAMGRLAESHDYGPARETLRVWNGGAPAAADTDGGSGETGGIDYEEVYGYGGASRMAKHRDTFTEGDVFIETDTIIARAGANGYIHLRFKKESEQGYSDALDWLIGLMKKGYSKVHDGYDFYVYFLAEPVFFEEMRGLMDEYLWPANDSHAFFCKAVRYPALRDKVAEFARLTLNEYDRYLNLDGEYSTVAGTFAAAAVSMADVKYMDTAIQYALETDGEHEQMAAYFSDILESRWGVTPETAPAIALLKMSYDHDDLGLSDDFWKYPQNLEAVTEYFSGATMHHKSHRIVRLANNIFGDAEDSLKKLKKLFKEFDDPKAKEIYAGFHNLVLEALEEEDGDEFGKPIDYKAPAPKEERISISKFKDLPENPPCLITPAEAKKRGFRDDEFDNEDDAGWCAAVFAPVIITDPYVYDFFESNREDRSNTSHLCYTIFNPDLIYTFRKKVAMDMRGAPYQFGMMVFDKKEATILYGLYDYLKVVGKVGGKKLDRTRLEELRDEFLYPLDPETYTGSPVSDKNNPAIKLMDEARGAIFDDRYLRAVLKLERIKPEDGEVYDASLIVMAALMRKKGDNAALKKIYETAAARMPRHKAYWDEKQKAL